MVWQCEAELCVSVVMQFSEVTSQRLHYIFLFVCTSMGNRRVHKGACLAQMKTFYDCLSHNQRPNVSWCLLCLFARFAWPKWQLTVVVSYVVGLVTDWSCSYSFPTL